MTRSGHAEQDTVATTDSDKPFYPGDNEESGCRPPLIVILIMLAVAIGALFFALQLFGVLSAIIFPASPPVPPHAEQLESSSAGHGLNTWQYEVPSNPCEVIAFYELQGATCEIVEERCTGTVYNSPGHSLPEIAICTSTEPFSIFGLRWTASISSRYDRYAALIDTTAVTIVREVLWGGMPSPTSTPANSQP